MAMQIAGMHVKGPGAAEREASIMTDWPEELEPPQIAAIFLPIRP